jgi:hypothetical protein
MGISDLIRRGAGRPYPLLGGPIKVIFHMIYQDIVGIPDLIRRWAGRPYKRWMVRLYGFDNDYSMDMVGHNDERV